MEQDNLSKETPNHDSMSEPMSAAGESHSEPVNAQATAAEATNETSMMDNPKLFATLGYIFPFLFFVPLIQDSLKHNAYARFHANQQLIVLIIWIGVGFISNNFLYMILGSMTYSLMNLVHLAILALAVVGAMNAYKMTMKELPFVGQFKILN